MSLMDDKIRWQAKHAENIFFDAMDDLRKAVMGQAATGGDKNKRGKAAIEEILQFYGAKFQAPPREITETNEALDFLLNPAGIMRRKVVLKGKWYKDGVGAMLGRTVDGTPVALLPRGMGGYSYLDPQKGKRVKITRHNAKDIAPGALCFYKPLPLKKLGFSDLAHFIAGTLSVWDYVQVAMATLAVSLLGMITPYVNELMFSEVVPNAQFYLILPVSVLLVGVTISSTMIRVTKSIIIARVNTKTSMAVQSATMMRVLSLPAEFFKKYNVGELSNRISSMNGLGNTLADALLSVAFTGIFSVVYLFQIFDFAPQMALPALSVLIANILFSVVSALYQLKFGRRQMDAGAKNEGLAYMLIAGVSKLKASGAERLAFSRWARQYAESASMAFNPPALIKFSGAVSYAISLGGAILLYYIAVKAKVGVAGYMAFNTSYGLVSGAFASLSGLAITMANVKTVMGVVEPILNTVPESADNKKIVASLSGRISINNVTFRYAQGDKAILDDLSLSIKKGEYVAIVGQSGCGKTTLLRLMLGLETPQKGAIYYGSDGLDKLNLHSLRRHIGVVMQSGQLFQGDIFSNITIGTPGLTMQDAWAAAEAAGIAEDIRKMPMGMGTFLSEGGGCISGGQKQRILIARALAAKPSILMLDEATSALDNITQAVVCEALGKMNCTRVVIAHRLSTIKQCNRIVVLDQGKIKEDGTYDELIRENGIFAALAQRQRLNLMES